MFSKPFIRLRQTAARAFLSAFIILSVVAAGLFAGAATAEANPRYAAYVIDVQSGKVLFSRYADEARFPASLTKMMTLYMLFEQLEAGRLRLDSRITMTRHAAGMPPTKLGIKPGNTISVEDAIKALVTKSANDVAAAIGDALGGSEAQFARAMTAKARSLGMSSTTFKNASGLPDGGQRTTARDMALLGIALNQHFPRYYEFFSTRSFNFGGHTYRNHNNLLGNVAGVDGIKTGYVRASGFNLVTSVRRDGRHIIAVVMGGRTSRTRDAHMRELVAAYLPQANPRQSNPVVVARTQTAPAAPAPAPITPARAAEPQVATAVPTPLIRPASAPKPSAEQIMAATAPAPTGPVPPAEIEQGSAEPMAVSAYAPNIDDAFAAFEQTAAGGWLVQIAAVAEESDALSMLRSAQSSVGGPLSSASPVTEQIEKGGTTLYRARFAGFDKVAAQAACDALKRNNYSCFAVQN